MSKKRPSSARKAISHSCFTSFVSCGRLKTVQSFLRESKNNKDDERPDAVLCILGIDSRFDEGHRELANYLLFDFLEGRNGEIEDEDETYEDVLLLISHSNVHVYCNPNNYPHLMPYVAHWPSLRIHCLTQTEYDENSDLAEDFKILSFIAMCQESQRVGMPFGTRAHPLPFDPFAIEKWPIVQASALEDYGGGGFFTMKHEILNINEFLWNLLDVVDPVVLEVLVTKKLPLFEKQWTNTMTNINIAFSSNSVKDLTEEEVAEPLQSFFAFGNLSRAQTLESSWLPYCLFGQHSSSSDRQKESEMPLEFAGIGKSQAKHMVIQAVSSKFPISCSRTYFFTSGHTMYPLSGGVVQAPRPPKSDIELLEKLYKGVIFSVMEAIETYTNTCSVTKAEESCLESLKEYCTENIVPVGLDLLKSSDHVCFFLHGMDSSGNMVSLDNDKDPGIIKQAGLKLLDIPSIEHSGDNLGSVEFSETFLNSKIVVEEDGGEKLNQRKLILTSAIPRCMTWEVIRSKENIANTVKLFVHVSEKPFGDVLVDGVSCTAFGSKELGSVTEGTLYICEEGVLFIDTGNNLAIVPMSYTEEITVFDGASYSSVAILCITYRHSLQQYLPLTYHCQEDVVVFVLTPRTEASRLFYSEVISKWQKRKNDPVLKFLDSAPESLSEFYANLQLKDAVTRKLLTKVKDIQLASANLQGFERFLNHLNASSVLKDVPVPESDLAVVLKEPGAEVNNTMEDNMIVVSLLTGVPGSHQEELCNALVNMAKEQNRWMVLKPPLDSGEFFEPAIIHNALTVVYNAARKQRLSVRAATGGRKKMRALLVVPGFTGTAEVVYAILNHPSPDVARHLCIGAITCCVDPLNTFLSRRLTFPLLQDQCSRGWVNNVLYTGSTETKSPDLEFCKDLIRKTNPDVAFILAEKGEIRRSTDAELIVSETSFMEPEMIRARHLSIPGWWKGVHSVGSLYPAFNKVCVQFFQPLDRNRFVANMRVIHTSTTKESLAADVYHIRGSTKFTDSDDLTEVYFTKLSGYLSLMSLPELPVARPPPSVPPKSPAPPQASPPEVSQPNGAGDNHGTYSLLFIGTDLEEGSLKTWLRTCARQKPSKLPLKTRKSLDEKEMQLIHEKHHLESLPQGWFYNGSQYVSLTGEKQLHHPCMDSFVEEYLNFMNEKIQDANNRIDSEKYPDLFEKNY
ncbi:hypothetical protein HOLleu_33876 [Holothuria leucospilota]|uniref:Uncharacterized protein n=1 Tax=Holothuria leucospilota TaxID=206669 RepID=A0A9Q0YPG9_HOLLE|nr:hypothetical protein HOLleu_33876 [Holothuria leucospilota]